MAQTYRTRILNAIEAVQEKGWGLIAGANLQTIDGRPCCCPMAALAIDDSGGKGTQRRVENAIRNFPTLAKRAGKILGVSPNVIEAFTCGFDLFDERDSLDFGSPYWSDKTPFTKATRAQARRFYQMGKRIRHELQDIISG